MYSLMGYWPRERNSHVQRPRGRSRLGLFEEEQLASLRSGQGKSGRR